MTRLVLREDDNQFLSTNGRSPVAKSRGADTHTTYSQFQSRSLGSWSMDIVLPLC